MVILNLTAIAFAAYLCGSIPTSIWVSKWVYGIDIRQHGSGNAGGTNVYRVLGWKPAVFVILVDIAKGLVPTLFFHHWNFSGHQIDPVYLQIMAGAAAVLGHVYTIFAGFRGGKGVATLLGMLAGLYPTILPICLIVFFALVFTTRYVALASMTATLALPASLLILRHGLDRQISPALIIFGFIIFAFICYTHRTNIKRLANGTESKFYFSKKAKPSQSDPAN